MTAHAASHLVPGWLSERRFDLGFIVGIALLAGVMASATVLQADLFWPMLTLHTWLFGYEHLVATGTRLFGRPDERARFFWLTWGVPPLVLLGLYAVGRAYGLTGVYVLYFVGQLHHTVRQSWGVAQQYRQRAGGLPWDRPWLSQLTLWSVAVWGLLHRCAQEPTEFLFIPFWLPQVPGLWVTLSAGVCLGLWTLWAVQRVAAYRRGELALGHTLYMASHFVVYLASYVLIDHLCSGWLLVNVWHNVQYIAFVWLYNRRRFAAGVDPQARTLSWLSQPGWPRLLLYGLASIALALPFYYGLPRLGLRLDTLWHTVVPSAITLGLTLTFHHYIVDAVVWKRRNNPSAV